MRVILSNFFSLNYKSKSVFLLKLHLACYTFLCFCFRFQNPLVFHTAMLTSCNRHPVRHFEQPYNFCADKKVSYF